MRLYTTTALALVVSALTAHAASAQQAQSTSPPATDTGSSLQAPAQGAPGFHHVAPQPVLIADWEKGRKARLFKSNVIPFQRAKKAPLESAKDQTTTASAFRAAGTVAPEVPTDIAELARALRYDPDLIYQFVRDNIELYPIYGIHKGALGALIDRQGTDADQAELMVYLLRASGYQASAVNGLVQLTKAQLQSFYGVPDNNCAIYNLFGSGRIPVDRFLCSNPSTSLGFLHFWVRVTINGQNYDFDPSFKPHTIKSPINLKSAAGYDQTTFMNNARTGATVTANTVTNLNRSNIRNQLTGYANNLISYIRANATAASLDDIIGGKTITPPATRNEAPTRQTVLPYQVNYPETVFTGEIPIDYRSILEISIGGQTIDLLADSFYGTRLTISPDVNNNLQLLADGELITTFNQLLPGATQDMTVRIFHNAYQDGGVNAGFIKRITGGETLAFTLGFGPTTKRLSKVYRDQIAAASKAGAPDSSEAIVGGGLSALGADIQAQLGMTMNLSDRQVGVNSLVHHFIGAVSEHDGGPLVDLKAIYVSAIQQDYNNVVGTASFISNTLHGSSFESGVLEQTFGGNAASTIRLLDDAIAGGQTIYSGTSANFESEVKPNLVNCSADDLADMSNYANSYRVIVPQNCAGIVEQWQGLGYLVANANSSNLFVSALIDGGYAGGYLGSRRDLAASDFRNKNSLLDRNQQNRGDPIDMSTGNFTYSHDDLVVGRGSFPEGLALQKVYNSGAREADGPLGRGWSHNLAMRIEPSADAFQGLGEDSPVDAATSIVETMVALDLLSDQNLPLDKIAAAVVGQRWFAEQFKSNAVNVTSDVGGSTFVKLPDGSYNPAPANSSRLVKNADGSFTQSLVDKSRYEFDPAGNVTAFKRPDGVEVHFGYTNGQLTSVQNSFGRSLTLAYDGNRVSSVQDGTGRSVSYGYDAAGNLASYTDANGKMTTFEYDQPGRMSKFYLPANPTSPQVINVYDSLGRIAQQTDADGKLWQVHVAGTRSELVSPLGNRVADYFDGSGRVIATLEDINSPDPAKAYWEPRQTQSWYDGLGRLVRQTDSRSPMIQLTYDDASCNSVEKRCTNNVLTRRQTAVHTADSVPALPDIVQSFTYEPLFNKVATATDGRGKTTNYAYDPATGNLTSVTLPPATDGGTLRPQTTYAYTSFGAAGFPAFTLPTSVTRNIDAANSVTSTTTYDAANGFVPKSGTVDSGGLNLTTTYGYDGVGNLTSVDGPRNDVADVTTYAYDAERRPTAISDALGKVTKTNYNADGDITSVAAQLGSQWAATCYDRLVSGKASRVIGPATIATSDACPAAAAPNSITELAYDDDGRLLTNTVDLSALEGGSRTTRYEYSPSGELVTMTAALGTPLEQTPLKTSTFYTDRTNSTSDATTDQRLFSANNAGVGTAPASKYLTLDGHGRLARVTFTNNNGGACPQTSGGYGCEQYGYDANANLTSWTRRDGQVFTFDYDNLNRVIKKTAPSRTDSISYTYDLLGRLLSATYAGSRGDSVSYTYDKAGRILSTTAGGRTVGYQYDAAGNQVRTTWPDGAFFVTYDYDALNRVSAIKEGGTSLLASYSYDDLSRRTSVTYGNGTAIGYGYDDQARLGSQTYDLAGTAADLTRTYGHDQSAAITSLATSNAAYDWNGHYDINRPYTNDGEDRYLTSGAKALTYDDRGNLAGDGTWTFAYDALNRLTNANVKNQFKLVYGYDPLNRLSSRKTSSKAIVNYLYDGDQLIGEYDGSGALIRRYVRGPAMDEPVVVYDGVNGATRTWLYADPQGSVTAAADAAGSPVSTMSYGPFGEPNTTTGVSLRYTGQFLDADSGLYYYKARWYSPYLGRFLSPDPAGFVDGLHMYAYVGNDPLNYADPTGLNKQDTDEDGSCKDTGTTNDLLRKLGGGLSTVGSGAQILGAGVGAFFPPAGAYIGGAGLLADGAGNLITGYANYSDGDYVGLANQAVDWGVGKLAGGIYKKAAKGSLSIPGKKGFQPNPLGGPLKNAKSEAAGQAAGKTVSKGVETVYCSARR